MSIERLPSGAWRIRVSGGRIPGTTNYRTLRRTLPAGSTKAELTRAELELRLEAGQTSVDADQTPVYDLCRSWIAQAELADTTRYNYTNLIARHLYDTPLGSMPTGRVRTRDIEHHYHTMTVGAATINKLHAVLSASFRRAVRLDWIAQSPTHSAQAPSQPKADIHAATPDAYRRAIAHATEHEPPSAPGLAAYIQFLGSTGCRPSEGLAVRWNRIGNDALICESVASAPNVGVIIKPTKTGDTRTIELGPSIQAVLRSHRARVAEICLAAGAQFHDGMLVFSKHGLGEVPWRPDTAAKQVKKAGVNRNTLRHMAATQSLAAGVPLETVAKRLGHKQTSTTQNIYSESLPSNDSALAAQLDDLANPQQRKTNQ